MQLTLDAKSELVVQREIALGHAADAAEVVARALEMVEGQTNWLQLQREAIAEKLERSFAQVERGEVLNETQLRQFLDENKGRFLAENEVRP